MDPVEKRLAIAIVERNGGYAAKCLHELFSDAHVPYQNIQKMRLCVSAASENPIHLDLCVPEVDPGGNVAMELAIGGDTRPAINSAQARRPLRRSPVCPHDGLSRPPLLLSRSLQANKEGDLRGFFLFFGCLVKEALPKATLVTGLEGLGAAQAAILPAAVAAAAATAAAAIAAAPAAAAAAIAAVSYAAAAAITAAAESAAFAEKE